MTVWLIEAGCSWNTMVTAAVFRKEDKGLSVFKELLKTARRETGLKIQHYTEEDGSHVSAWGDNKLRLRPMEVLT